MPVAINRTYKRGKNSFYKSREASGAQESMAWEARSQYAGLPLVCPLAVSLAFWWPNGRKDIDSSLKSVLDALQSVVYENDGQIMQLRVSKGVDKAQPRVEVVISEI